MRNVEQGIKIEKKYTLFHAARDLFYKAPLLNVEVGETLVTFETSIRRCSERNNGRLTFPQKEFQIAYFDDTFTCSERERYLVWQTRDCSPIDAFLNIPPIYSMPLFAKLKHLFSE